MSVASSARGKRAGSVDTQVLFGQLTAPKSKPKKMVQVTGKDTVLVRDPIYLEKVGGIQESDSIVIPLSDLQRLKATAHKTARELAEEHRQALLQDNEERQKTSEARKEKMMRLEEERRKRRELSEMEKVELEEKNAILRKARQALDESMDDVKAMNQMMLYAKVATIRDAQLDEKEFLSHEKAELERVQDTVMEIERLKALQMYEEREQRRLEDQRRGAAVIVEQISDRMAQKQREEDLRAQERAYVLKQIEALRLEEIEQQKQRKDAAAKLMQQVNEANAAALHIKEERALADRLEDQKIVEYRKRREEQERARETEIKAEKARKEAEVAKLRARQEKAQDKASELDALRAKRAIEAAERAAREKAAQEAARHAAINAELAAARKIQQAEKEKRIADQAALEQDEFNRIISVQLQHEAAEKKRAKEEAETRKHHAQELRNQISSLEEKHLQQRRDFLEEGNLVRAQVALERKKLEQIKTRKIDELKKAGVPDKYTSDLARKKLAT